MSRWARIVFLVMAGLAALPSCRRSPGLSSAAPVSAAPRIDPDYSSIVLPPNIAPLNFRVLDEGRDCVVRISSDAALPIEIHCPDRVCRIGVKTWRELLDRNKGKHLYYDIFVRAAGSPGAWKRFARVTNTVAEEPIDPWIVYRQITPNNHVAIVRGIFQRNVESFDASAIVTLHDGTFGCFNCHSFCRKDPNRFLLQLRGPDGGMMVVADGKIRKINTEQPPLWRPLGYTSWHPDGRHVAATLNQFFAYDSATEKSFQFETEAIDKKGSLVVYDIEKNAISTAPQVFENTHIAAHPCWSADGKCIYYVGCKDHPLRAWPDFNSFRFDLMRVSYDVATDAWGVPETVVEFSKSGKSCAFPDVSPDGRYILLSLSDRTMYPIYQRSSDLYVLDLQTMQYRRLDAVNSDCSESYPRWASNGRWLCFLSTRRGGMSALPYFAYFDVAGKDHKPFLLPQEQPDFYDTFTDAYNVTEFVKSKVTISPFTLAEAMQQPAIPALVPNPPKVDAYTGATRIVLPGLQRRSYGGPSGAIQ